MCGGKNPTPESPVTWDKHAALKPHGFVSISGTLSGKSQMTTKPLSSVGRGY